MLHSFVRPLLALSVIAATAPAFGQLVPGAQGFGANVTGPRPFLDTSVSPAVVRYPDVYHVTTLADDPTHVIPGSLFYGLYEKNVPAAGRTIVFDIGGTIQLGSSTLDIKNIRNVTIAGQTAPTPITIVGNTVQITSSGGKETGNILLQHIAIRKGLANSGDALSIKGSGNTHDILVDHVSGSWSEDEVISVAGATNHSTNVTVQYSTMSEALTSGHQYGALIRNDSSASVSYLHNLFSNNVSRNPRPGTYLGTQLDFEFQNNVIYNWQDRAGYTGGASGTDTENVNMNYVGNYLIAGPSTVGGPTLASDTPVAGARRNTAFTKDTSGDPINLKVFQSGNKIDWIAGPPRDGQDIGWGAFASWNGTTSSAFSDADKVASFAYPAASAADSAEDAYGRVIGSVGAFPWARTTTDQRLVNEVLTYTGVSGQTAPNAAEWNALLAAPATARPAGWDTDQDGMPNAWETLHGTNPAVADNDTLMPNQLTTLENYLRSLSLQAAWGDDASGNWSAHIHWRGIRPGAADATASFGSIITAPRTITLDAPATVGQIAFASAQPYTLAGAAALTLEVFAGTATVDVSAGSHAVNAPVQLLNATRFTITPAGSILTLGALQDSTVALSKAGAGTLAVNPFRAGSLTLSEGKVALIPGSGGPSAALVQALSLAAGTRLDLGAQGLILQAADNAAKHAALSALAAQLASGKNGGTWTGEGITSGVVAADATHNTTVALIDNADLGLLAFGGRAVNANSLLMTRALLGDADLSGVVDLADFNHWFNHVGSASYSFAVGDFNTDGTVDLADFNAWFAHVGASLPLVPATAAAIPEPTSLTLLIFGSSLLLRRRRP